MMYVNPNYKNVKINEKEKTKALFVSLVDKT